MKDNKIILITGASSDVGSALIRKIACNYTHILAHYNSSRIVVDQLAEELGEKVIPVQADFSSTDSIAAMIEDITSRDLLPDHILHLSARKMQVLQFRKESVESFESDYQTSVLSIVQILKAFMPNMAKQKYGKVVFMLTANVVGNPAKFQSAYTTNNYALLGLMKSLAVEYADKGVTVNGLSPDMIETRFLSELPTQIVEQGALGSALGRNLTVEDVVPTIEYLLSDATDSMSGANIVLTGGAK